MELPRLILIKGGKAESGRRVGQPLAPSNRAKGPSEPWLRRDYTHLWRLPPPLPPRRLPVVPLIVVTAVLLFAICVGIGG